MNEMLLISNPILDERVIFFFKQMTAYEMRISDWNSDVCSSDLRSRSVSSIRSRNRPPCFLAHSQLWSAVRTLPTCRVPVGAGAKRVTTVIARAYSRYGHAVTTNCSRGDAEQRRGMRSEGGASVFRTETLEIVRAA